MKSINLIETLHKNQINELLYQLIKQEYFLQTIKIMTEYQLILLYDIRS